MRCGGASSSAAHGSQHWRRGQHGWSRKSRGQHGLCVCRIVHRAPWQRAWACVERDPDPDGSGARENGDDGRGSSCKGHSCCKGPARLWLGGGRWRVKLAVEGGEGDSGRREMEMMVGGDGDWKTEVDDGRLQVS